jgi:hypothetical protein
MRIPVKDLRELAKKLGLSHVIVFATDKDDPTMQRIATYGHTKKACSEAADFGDKLKDVLGWPQTNRARPAHEKKP